MGVSRCFTFNSLLDMIFYGTRVIDICSRCTYIAHFTWLVRKPIYVLTNIRKGFPDSSVGKESAYNTGDPSLIPGSGRFTGEGIGYPLQYSLASLVTQLVKNLPARREIWVRSLGWKDPLEKGKATHSSILAWRILWTVHVVTKSQTWLSNFHFHFHNYMQ